MTFMPITPLRLLLGASGAILLARAIFGPYRLLVMVDSPLTAATVFGLALLASMALAAGEPRKAAPAMPGILIAAVLGAVVLCFVRAIP